MTSASIFRSWATLIGFALAVPVASLPLVGPDDLSGQLQGVVVDPEGAPVEGATVELWGETRRLSARLTNAAGEFSFPEGLGNDAVGFYVGRLGFKSAQVPYESAARSGFRITIETQAIALSGFLVEASEELCFEEDDREAKRLWASLADRYSQAIDTVGVATYLASAELVVPIGAVGPVELPEFSPGQRGSNSLLRFSWRRHIERSGYARRVRRTDLTGSYDSWTYPPLDADFSGHFVDPLFGELHRFRFEDADDNGWTVGFCARDRNEEDPWLTGRLRIAADTTLQWAEWMFRTAEPYEGAGGRAVFPEVVSDPEHTFLLPTEGLFYRRTGEEELVQRYQRFEGWIVAEGDSVPFLPLRNSPPDTAGTRLRPR